MPKKVKRAKRPQVEVIVPKVETASKKTPDADSSNIKAGPPHPQVIINPPVKKYSPRGEVYSEEYKPSALGRALFSNFYR